MLKIITSSVVVFILFSCLIQAQGRIIKTEPFIPHRYETFDTNTKSLFSQDEYNKQISWYNSIDKYDFSRIEYFSNGLKVVGILAKVKQLEPNKKYPVVIFNRGGMGEFGKVNLFTLKERFEYLLSNGYIVLATQYRGNDGSEGRDEYGGEDVYDVLNLVQVAQQLPYADSKNIFMIGHSRGGMMTYLALTHNPMLKAAVIIAGPTNLFNAKKYRPDLYALFSQNVLGNGSNEHEELEKRSASFWAHKLNVPLLILHGKNDKSVDVQEAQQLAQELSKHNKQYKLIIYPNGSHGLLEYEHEINQKILQWLKEHYA